MAMSTDSNELVQGEQPSLQPGTDQDYRLLEQGYHQSAAYAQMVESLVRGRVNDGVRPRLPEPERHSTTLHQPCRESR